MAMKLSDFPHLPIVQLFLKFHRNILTNEGVADNFLRLALSRSEILERKMPKLQCFCESILRIMTNPKKGVSDNHYRSKENRFDSTFVHCFSQVFSIILDRCNFSAKFPIIVLKSGIKLIYFVLIINQETTKQHNTQIIRLNHE